MLARWRAAGLIWPTIMTALMLPFLISLGTWQLHRKAWKEDLIAKIEARRTAEPVTLKEALDRNQKQAGEIEYLRVTTTGTFDYTKERHLYLLQVILCFLPLVENKIIHTWAIIQDTAVVIFFILKK